MTVLRFPSGDPVDVSGMPGVSSGRTTLADGSEGDQLQPGLAAIPPAPWGMQRLPSTRLLNLALELGELLDAELAEGSEQEPWFEWAATVERQALGELARRAI